MYQVRIIEEVDFGVYQSYEYGSYDSYTQADDVCSSLVSGGYDAYVRETD